MTPERWRQVEEIVHAALSRGESERPAFLAQKCAGDEALRGEVESLLAQQASATGFLEDPLVAGALRAGETGASILTGRRLGGYEIHARIGVGGMGEVYRARDTKLGRDVAIKILPSAFSSDPRSAGAVRSRGARARVTQSSPHRRDLRTGRRRRRAARWCSNWSTARRWPTESRADPCA